MQTVSHVRAGGASDRGREKREEENVCIRPEEKKKRRGQGGGKTEGRELMRAKKKTRGRKKAIRNGHK